jgi:hypothetical protein
LALAIAFDARGSVTRRGRSFRIQNSIDWRLHSSEPLRKLHTLHFLMSGVSMIKRFIGRTFLFVLMVWLVAVAQFGMAQQSSGEGDSSRDSGDKWDEITDRMVFLMTRLVNIEAALDVIQTVAPADATADKPIQSGGAKKSEGKAAANASASAPNNWREYYAVLAEKFYFHPAGRRADYHALAILSQPPAKDCFAR